MDRREWILSRCTKEDKILEVGAADGWLWKGTNFNVTLLDINEFAPCEFPRVVANAVALPFPDNSFDVVVCAEIWEHMPNPIAGMREAARVAAKKVVFTTPEEHYWSAEKKPLMPIEERLKEVGNITAGELYKRDNSACVKVCDEAATYHHRWYTKPMLEEQLKYVNLPYELELVTLEGGWVFLMGEIYKDKNTPLAEQADQILRQRLATQGQIIKPAPAPSVIGHVKYETLPQTKSLHIDTWSYCNASCRFCRYNTLTRPKGKMDMKLLEHILDDAATWPQPLEEIVPIHYGEFFLNPEWYEILKLIERKLPQTAIVLPTNGSMLDPATVLKLTTIRTLRLLNISVNAYFAETYEQLMGLKADTILRIKEAVRYLKVLMSPITVWLSMVYDPSYQTEKEKDLFEQEWQPYGIVKVHPTSFCRDYRKPAITSKIPCRSIFIDFVFLWDGRVAPCCWDSNGEIIVGDVTKQKILDVWHGEAMNTLRELHNQGRRDEIELCSLCSFS